MRTALLVIAVVLALYLWPEEPEPAKPVYHTVSAGETLWSIAETYRPEKKYILEFLYEIQEANKQIFAGRPRGLIHPGDLLVIPGGVNRGETAKVSR